MRHTVRHLGRDLHVETLDPAAPPLALLRQVERLAMRVRELAEAPDLAAGGGCGLGNGPAPTRMHARAAASYSSCASSGRERGRA